VIPELNRRLAAAAGVALLTLAGCGGGSPPADIAPAPTASPAAGAATAADAPVDGAAAASRSADPILLEGTVATGAPLSEAVVKAHDAAGIEVCSATTAPDGTYRCVLPATSSPPYVIVASRDATRLVSVHADAASGTVNVTPLTHLVAAMLSPTGDPARLAEQVRAAPALVDAARIRTSVLRVMTALQPLATTLGVGTDPISGRFAADGTGHDQLLDLLQVSVRPEAGGADAAANVEITVRVQPATADADPVRIAFRSNAVSVPVLDSAAVSAAAVTTRGDNLARMVADFTARMTACYALPSSVRVTQGNRPGSRVQAPECLGLFVGDDPSSYRSNGWRVGPDGAFRGLFAEGSGVVFDRGVFEFIRADGDLVISYRWVAPGGNTDHDTLVLRQEGGRLKAIGNGYRHDARVRPFAQRRDLINAPSFSSHSTGYNVWIANRIGTDGRPIFARVEVTTPRGSVLTYRPNPGVGWLLLQRADGSLSSGPVLRLAGRWIDPVNAASLPATERSMVFTSPMFTDRQIVEIPDQSVWRLEFFHADGSPSVVQTYRTTSRALTLGEIQAAAFAEPTDRAVDELRLVSAATGRITFTDATGAAEPNRIDLSSAGGGEFWRVPDGANPPTSVSVFGQAPAAGPRFSDTTGVPSSARRAQIRCSSQSVGDTHCDGTRTDQYASGSFVDAIELWARDARQVEFSTLIGLYRLQ